MPGLAVRCASATPYAGSSTAGRRRTCGPLGGSSSAIRRGMDEAEQAIIERVASHAPTWFPGTAPNSSVHLRPLSAGRRSRLYAVSLGDPSAPPMMVAKVRNEHTAVSGRGGAPGRPTLSATAVDEAVLTAREYSALRHLETVFPVTIPGSARSVRWRTCRVSTRSSWDWRPAYRCEGWWSDGVACARTTARRPRSGSGVPDRGCLAARSTTPPPPTDHPVRQGTTEEVVAHFEALEDFLGRRLGRGFGLAGAGSALAGRAAAAR